MHMLDAIKSKKINYGDPTICFCACCSKDNLLETSVIYDGFKLRPVCNNCQIKEKAPYGKRIHFVEKGNSMTQAKASPTKSNAGV
mmetsp:Transcript_12606/g.16367  ORF Transcript_12606/g.16367 Transcript_12606/m.16367 type:complete len:85 (-) Transcript_12606:898-1152(-)